MKTVLLIALITVSVSISAQNYKIGHRKIMWVDSSRNNRSVPLEVYYPANTSGDDVPVVNNNKKFAMVVFGHGYQLTYADYVWLKDSLVPKGFFLAFPRTEEQLFPSHTDFAKDYAFIINQFDKNKSNQSEWFYSRLNSKYAVSGHSMGGGCSLLSVQYSNKINAVYNFAAAETNPSAIAACTNINIPALLFAGGKDCISPPADNQQPMYNNIKPFCKTYVEITKAKHCHWSNNSSQCVTGEFFCSFGSSPAKPTLTTTFSLMLPWLNYFLNGNVSEGSRFQKLLGSTSGIAHQQSCNLNNVTAASTSQNQAIKIYPSIIAKGAMINIDISLLQQKSLLQITNQNGRVVYTENVLPSAQSIIQLSTSNYNKGIYFVMITARDKICKSSFMVE